MKSYLLLLALFGFAALTGCTADDLAGPDVVADDPVPLAQSSHDDLDHTRRPASLMGAWRATDPLGSITLFLDEDDVPSTSGPVMAQPFGGKGIVSDRADAPIAVLLEGQYKGRAIAFTLSDERGETIAKAKGSISTDFLLIKVVLLDAEGNERHLVFDRF
jgi:hypothetical protein